MAARQVIGAPLAAALLLMDGVGGRHGWTWLFLIEGLMTILFGVAVYLFLPRRPATLRVLQPAERTWLQERHEHADRHARSQTTSGGQFWGECMTHAWHGLQLHGWHSEPGRIAALVCVGFTSCVLACAAQTAW